MPSSHPRSLFLSGVLFIGLMLIGFLLSQHKLLWIDECYTQHFSVDAPSYADILTLHFPDGNKSPLFYILQKINCNLFSFRYPNQYAEGSYDVANRRSQIIIRFPSDVYMSLGLAAIFYYFTRFFSLFSGIYALIVALVSPMIWMYWVEARPYSLWFLLTTAQLLLYCSTVRSPKIKVDSFISVTHVLLILTTPGSILQIFIIGMMLVSQKGYEKRRLLNTCLLPACIFLIYYLLVPMYKFKTVAFVTCLFDVVMPERLIVYAFYAVTAWVMSKEYKESSNAFFLSVFLLFLMSGCFMLFIRMFTDHHQFAFHSRYLIYLVPADILMFSLASFDLWRWSLRNRWVCMNVSIFLACLLIIIGYDV